MHLDMSVLLVRPWTAGDLMHSKTGVTVGFFNQRAPRNGSTRRWSAKTPKPKGAPYVQICSLRTPHNHNVIYQVSLDPDVAKVIDGAVSPSLHFSYQGLQIYGVKLPVFCVSQFAGRM